MGHPVAVVAEVEGAVRVPASAVRAETAVRAWFGLSVIEMIKETDSPWSVTANGTIHTGRIVVTGTSSAAVYVDGVSKGTIATNIPTVNLTAFFSNSTWTGAIETDFMFVEQDR